MLTSLSLRSHDYIPKSVFSSFKCQQIILGIGPQEPLIIAHRFPARRSGARQLQRPRAAARGQCSVAFGEKLRLGAARSSRRRLSASLPLISPFLPPSPPHLFPPSSSSFLCSLFLRTPARNLPRNAAGSSGCWMSLSGSLSALLPPERVPTSAAAAGCREEEEEDEEERVRAGEQRRREEWR